MVKITKYIIFGILLFNSNISLSAECDLSFADRLENCVPHICEFTHEILPIRLTRRIVGKQEDGKCLVLEDMPGNFHLQCKYNMNDLAIVTKKYLAIAAADKVNILINKAEKSDIKLDGKALKYTREEDKIFKEACHIYMNGQALSND